VCGDEGSEGPANPWVYKACPLPSRLASHFSRYLSRSSANSFPSSYHRQSDSAMALANFDVIEVVNLTSPLPTDSCEQLCEPVLDLGHGRDDYDEDDQPLPSLEKV
jgi:hypothetical protein